VAFVLPCAQAQTAPTGPYLGAAAGLLQENGLQPGGFEQAMRGQGLTLRTERADHQAAAWRLFAGWRINTHAAVEAGFAALGRFHWTGQVSADPGTVQAQWATRDWNLSMLGLVPLADGIDLFGKAGWGLWRTRLDASGQFSGSAARSMDAGGSGPLMGAGLQVRITPTTSLRIEGERFYRIGQFDSTGRTDLSLWSIGLQHHF
jgi:hypothetical protein